MPGLLRGVARTAVVAGTASAVSGRVQRRQQGRWAEQDAYAAQQQAAAYARPPAAPPPSSPGPLPAATPAPTPTDSTLIHLRELADMRAQGILTDAEFEAQKDRILNG